SPQLWVTQNFESPTKNKIVDIVLSNKIKQLEKMGEDLDINATDNMIMDNETEVDKNNN
ncbi:hypothetical protein INT46_010845, partial [Mucor plumbeus]